MHLDIRGEGTRISQDPKRLFHSSRDSKAQEHTERGERLKEGGTLTKQKLSQRSRERKAKANKGREGLREAGTLSKQNAVPERAGQKANHIREETDPERPGAYQNGSSRKVSGTQQQQVLFRFNKLVISMAQ